MVAAAVRPSADGCHNHAGAALPVTALAIDRDTIATTANHTRPAAAR
ncbi:hypothetical protein [Trebonia kvetii]|nr:hypothetical protein [Trebonia kvetii]